METFAQMQDGASTGETGTRSEMAAALSQLETELFERVHLQEELYRLVGDLEMRLAESTAELARQKNKAISLGEELESFSYSVSHDLRAPLRHLIGFSGALTEDFGEGLEPTAQTYLQCIAKAGRKMEGLIEALLCLSRTARQELVPSGTDLAQLARQCAAALKEEGAGREVEFLIPDRLFVQADPQLMRLAMEQLIGNAWKFTGSKEKAVIELGSKREGEGMVYFVRDDGVGFDPCFAGRLFGPFQRMHREEEFPGTGIGLALAQRIIRRHGGRIWAESGVDRGATFFFTLSD